MSATAAERGHRSQAPGSWAPIGVRAWLVGFSLIVIAVVAFAAATEWEEIVPLAPQMIVWAMLVAAADMLPVQFWGRVTFTMSLTVAIAVALTLPPAATGLLLLLATVDPRELRGEVRWDRALFNRSQVALSVMVASATFHRFGTPLTDWPAVIGPALVAVTLDCLLNLTIMSVAAGLVEGASPLGVIRHWFSGVPALYLLTYSALGVMALLMATLTAAVGMWGAVVFLAPLALARQTFLQTQGLDEVSRRIGDKDRALVAASERAVEERRDERRVVAGELHDEVLPCLFKVNLLAQVLRQDLSSGRLLDLENDVPELLSASAAAQEAIRRMMVELRESMLVAGGLRNAFRIVAEGLETAGSPRIELDIQDEDGLSRVEQFLVYQVGREAMNNAAHHSRGRLVTVRQFREGSVLRLIVVDDGIGFDTRLVARTAHFGLQLIAERVVASGGRVELDSRIGSGTSVSLILPVGVPTNS
jgi:signal transduction histidine kinase